MIYGKGEEMKNRIIVFILLLICLGIASGCGKDDEVMVTGNSVASEQVSSVQSSLSRPSAEISQLPNDLPPVPEVSAEPVPKKATAEDLAVIEDYDTKYFVKKLDDEAKYRFVELYKAVSSFSEGVVFDTPPSEKELSLLMILLNYDCPEIIQINGDYFPEYGPDDKVTGLKFSYIMDKKEYSAAVKKLDKELEIMKQKTEGKSDYETEKIVYDTIFQNTQYLEDDKYAGSIYGTLCRHVGRCEGFSKSFEWFMRKMGFECLALYGSQTWNTAALYTNHSWNILKIDDSYYQVDVTADNVQKGDIMSNPANYGFFNTDDTMIMTGRSVDPLITELGIPECKSTDLNYHVINGLYLKEGEGTADKMIELIREFDSPDGIRALSIKYESSDEYKKALGYARKTIDNYTLNETGSNYQYAIYYNDLSQTVMFDRITSNVSVSGG